MLLFFFFCKGIVEQGFGDFPAFNQIIRHVFNERMQDIPLTCEEWQVKLEAVAAARLDTPKIVKDVNKTKFERLYLFCWFSLVDLVDLLIEKETIDGDEFVQILSKYTTIPEKERTPQLLWLWVSERFFI